MAQFLLFFILNFKLHGLETWRPSQLFNKEDSNKNSQTLDSAWWSVKKEALWSALLNSFCIWHLNIELEDKRNEYNIIKKRNNVGIFFKLEKVVWQL